MKRNKNEVVIRRPKAVKFDRNTALLLLRQGYTYREVAAEVGCSRSALHSAVAHLLPDNNKVSVMRELQGDILLETLYDLLDAIRQKATNDSDIALGTLTSSVNTLMDKYQLLTGGVTSATETRHTGNIKNNQQQIIDVETIDSLPTDKD